MTKFPSDFRGAARPLSSRGIELAAFRLGTSEAAIWAIINVETAGHGFLADRRPVLLFERHVFSRLTYGRSDDFDADISNITPGGYGAPGPHQYERLARAMKCDAGFGGAHALQAASWGIGQVMGFNFKLAGFGDVGAMVAAMCEGEDEQLAAMATFIEQRGLGVPLRNHRWTEFARGYNGPAQKGYDTRLSVAYSRAAAHPPHLGVRTAQVYLQRLGHQVGRIDGVMGARTGAALEKWAGRPVGEITNAMICDLRAAASNARGTEA